MTCIPCSRRSWTPVRCSAAFARRACWSPRTTCCAPIPSRPARRSARRWQATCAAARDTSRSWPPWSWPLNTNSGKTNSWCHPDYAAQPWPDVEKRHATMIRRVDDAVGDILQLLRDLGLETNTLVIFTSDNGPHNEDGQDPRFFDSWGKMDGIKRDLWEAGVREPTIVSWPGHVPSHSANDTPSCFWDWMPTFADLAGLAPPAPE